MSKLNKYILWCVMVAITSFWMWASVQVWLRGSLFEVGDAINLGVISLLFILTSALLAIGLIIFQNRLWTVYLGVIVGLTYSLLFKISNINLVGIGILVLLFYHAQDIVHAEVGERIRINSQALIRKGLTHFVVAFFVLISFAAYQSPAIDKYQGIKRLPSASELFIEKIIEQTMGPRIEGGTPEQKQTVLKQVSKDTINEFNTFLKPYFQYAPPALAFGLFLILWSVGWVLTWLSVFIGMAIFQLLKKTKFIKFEEADVKAQRIVI